MGKSARIKRLIVRLHGINPYCIRCGVKMILPNALPGYGGGKIKYFPDNTCTYEHRFTRFEMEDRLANQTMNSILCLKCNQELARKEEKRVSIEELRKRSGRPELRT